MKKTIILLLVIVSNISLACSQMVYYGIPSANAELKKGDVIITTIPPFSDCHFIKSKSFETMAEFISDNSKRSFRIEINYFFGTSEFSNNLTLKLANDLERILKERYNSAKLTVISNGKDKPLFLNKSSPKYKEYNTRLDIYIE